MKKRIKIKMLLQIITCVSFLFIQTSSFAQSKTVLTKSDDLPEIKNENVQSMFNSVTLDTGQRSSVASLTSGCKTVETGNSAAFSLLIIDYKDIDIPINDVKAVWMPSTPINPDASINGIDSDGDCVRDDIERYIGMLFKDKNQQRLRRYLFEYAKWLGFFIKISDWSFETSRNIAREQFKATKCIRNTHGYSLETTKMIDRIFANFHNTLARSKRYIVNNTRLGGWSTRENFYVICP